MEPSLYNQLQKNREFGAETKTGHFNTPDYLLASFFVFYKTRPSGDNLTLI